MKDAKEFSAVKNSIQTRLSGVMLLVLVFALGINVFIFAQIRTAVGRIDAVFSSNTAINELSDSIEQVESTVYEYLNTNSSQALENYYRYEQNYRNLLEDLNDRNLDNEAKMLEKNIRRMSETYLDQTNETVQAKRGRNVEKYKTSYEDEHKLYEYINSYSYNLNNLRFKMNSANYQLLLSAMNVLYKLCIAVMLVVYALGLVVTTLLVRNMIRPLTALSNTAHEVAKGNLNVPQLPVVVEDEVGIVERAGHTVALRYTDAHVCARGLCRCGEALRLRAGHDDRVVTIELPVLPAIFIARADREAERHAVRVAGDEQLRKHDQLRTLLRAFRDQAHGLVRARGLVKQHRRRLHDGDAARRFEIFHMSASLIPSLPLK